MKFLSKLGQIFRKMTGIVKILGPDVAAVIPGTKDDALIANAQDSLTEIGGIIALGESFGQQAGLDGAQKLLAVTPAVAQIILRSDMLAAHKIKDQALFQKGVTQIAGGMADVLNSLEDKIEVVDKV